MADSDSIYAQLLQHLSALSFPGGGNPERDLPPVGVPGFVAVSAPNVLQAFPLAFGKDGNFTRPVAAALCAGTGGRAVIVAHDGYLNEPHVTDIPFLQRCLAWLGGGPLSRNKVQPGTILLWDGSDAVNPADVERFLANGGRALLASCPWGYGQLHPGTPLTSHPINLALSNYGVHLVSGCAAPLVEGNGGDKGFDTQSTSLEDVVNGCCHPSVWSLVSTLGSGEIQQIPVDVRCLIDASNGELEAARACYGVGGWWATTQLPCWLTVAFQEEKTISELSVWCVNVDACPKLITVTVLDPPSKNGPAVWRADFPTKVNPEDQQNKHQRFNLKASLGTGLCGKQFRIQFEGIHNSHYIGVNEILFFHEVTKNPAPTGALGRVMDDLPPGLVSTLLEEAAKEGHLLDIENIEPPSEEFPCVMEPHQKALTAALLDRSGCASYFPGSSSAPRSVPEDWVKLTAADAGQWVSTHSYAAAREPITLFVLDGSPDGNLLRSQLSKCFLRIGCHSDDLAGESEPWKRWPRVTQRIALSKLTEEGAGEAGAPSTPGPPGWATDNRMLTLKVVPKWDGLIFFEVEKDITPIAVLFDASVSMAPHYRCADGELVSKQDGKAPWGEVEGTEISFLLPTTAIEKHSEDIPEVMEFWDRVVSSHHCLASPPYGNRKERVVVDVQLSLGYMHSGYPVMAHLDFAERALDVSLMKSKGDWGMFHELGHNMQRSWWTWDATVEVTVNLFTLWTMQQVLSKMWSERDLPEFYKADKFADYKRQPNYAVWKEEPFIALHMFGELIETFGFESIVSLFHRYEEEEARCGAQAMDSKYNSDQSKMDQLVVNYSQLVGVNLYPFFTQEWGLPISPEVQREIQPLEAWVRR